MVALKKDYLFEDEKDVPFSFTFYKNAFIYYIGELFLYSGNFFNIFAECIIIKYNLSKFYIILLILFQMILYPFHMIYLFNFKIIFVVIIIVLSIIEIFVGIIIYKKYYKRNSLISEFDENKHNTQISQPLTPTKEEEQQ